MPNIYRGREGQGKAVRRQERDEWFRHNPRDSWSHQKLEGTSPADNQISDFWPAEPWENKYVLS